MTEAKQKFQWTDECERAFKKLKETLTSTPILTYPQPDKLFILDTDASNESVGSVVSQEKDGKEHVIASGVSVYENLNEIIVQPGKDS